jgi:calmodulin-regulated spectrin-associated protein
MTNFIFNTSFPFKNAHLAVIEAMMVLYAKEITSGERIHSAISRLTAGTPPANLNSDQLLLLWVSHAMAAMKYRLEHQQALTQLVDDKGKSLKVPDIPSPVQDFTSLCDGVCLAYLIAFYCPKLMPWQKVRISYLPTVEDSLHNVLLIHNFSKHHLPYTVFHLTPEDVTYSRG